jgi:hypothetical protein
MTTRELVALADLKAVKLSRTEYVSPARQLADDALWLLDRGEEQAARMRAIDALGRLGIYGQV